MKTYKIADILTQSELEQLSRAVSASRLSFNKAATAWLDSQPQVVSKLQAHGLHAPYFAYQIEALTK